MNDILKKYILEIVKKVSLSEEMLNRGIDIIETGINKKAICPFHGDSDPSLVIYDTGKHPHAHCFGCGVHFDVFWFVYKWEKINKKQWTIKDTLFYFKKKYNINSIVDSGEMNNSFLDEEIFQKEEDKSKLILGDYYRIASIIKKALRKSPFPEFDFKKLKPIMKSMDNDVFFSTSIDFLTKESFIKILIDGIDRIRYDKKLSRYKSFLYGNVESSNLIITSIEMKEKILAKMLSIGKDNKEFLFLIIDEGRDFSFIPDFLKNVSVNKIFIIGDLFFQDMCFDELNTKSCLKYSILKIKNDNIVSWIKKMKR